MGVLLSQLIPERNADMKTDAYGEHLRARGVDDAEIKERAAVIRAFAEGLRALGTELGSAGREEVARYAETMIADGSNSPRNFDILCDYALWRGLRALYVLLVEVTDCGNAMEKLAETIEQRYGAAVRARIFSKPAPPLGTGEDERVAYTREITRRMAELLSPEKARAAWFQVQHGISAAFWRRHDLGEKERYSRCETLDAFLKAKLRDRNEMLKGLRERGELWFTMELTDEVLDFLTGEPHMKFGEHGGKAGIIVTKVPYRPALYLRETDEKRKRYYACHCPLIRGAILRGEPVSADVCYCSLGHASHFLAGIGLEDLRGEVLQSAAQGDERCRFIFYLPDGEGENLKTEARASGS